MEPYSSFVETYLLELLSLFALIGVVWAVLFLIFSIIAIVTYFVNRENVKWKVLPLLWMVCPIWYCFRAKKLGVSKLKRRIRMIIAPFSIVLWFLCLEAIGYGLGHPLPLYNLKIAHVVNKSGVDVPAFSITHLSRYKDLGWSKFYSLEFKEPVTENIIQQIENSDCWSKSVENGKVKYTYYLEDMSNGCQHTFYFYSGKKEAHYVFDDWLIP